jgi:dCTP diphosphatase
MNDNTSNDLNHLKDTVRKFIQERDWQKHHTLKNLSMDIAIEASELMEHFLWSEGSNSLETLNTKRAHIEEEVADVFFSLLCFCNEANIDLSQALQNKLILTAERYPVDKAKGKTTKHTNL